jgi:virginiamycin B lyase
MSQRPLLFVVIAACLSSSVLIWSQTLLLDRSRQDAAETLRSERHEPRREEGRNVAESTFNLRPLSRNRTNMAAGYLAQNAPEKTTPAAEVPAGVEVSIKEWPVPTPGSHPHDPLATQDGSIWYTGQMANLLGRLDPRTGEFKEYRLRTPESGPHGLVADKDGNIWFTANFKGYIGKLDPKTGEISEYPMPDPKAPDPHTLVFDQKGILWFTVQGGNMVGRLVPWTGEVQLVAVPTPHANPYGMVVNSAGVPFFAEFGSNKLASIDPDTLQIREYVLPHVESRPRRIAITSDDVIWYSDYARGALGRFDPKTGEAHEWPSPGGSESGPYGIATLNDVIWYSESGRNPNNLVRFDSKTETFQTWLIPSGGGVVRNMMPTQDGNLVLACSGVNRIALVEVKRR